MDRTKRDLSLYDSILQISNDYLGPTAKRFIDRQIENHVNKRPEDIEPKDLENLIDWIKVAVALLTEDKKVVQEYADRLLALTKTEKKAPTSNI